MKRLSLILLPCFLLLIWGCKKTCTCTTVKEEYNPNRDKLCISQGWRLTNATVNPAFPMDGYMTNDWYNDWLFDYEKDDIIKFLPDGTQIIEPGNKLPSDDYDGYTQSQTSTWAFYNDETWLRMQIPFFYDYNYPSRTFSPQFEEAEIVELSSNRLILKHTATMTFAKETYTFTLTYAPKGYKNSCDIKSAQHSSIRETTVKTKGKCSDLNSEATIIDFDGTRYLEKTECK